MIEAFVPIAASIAERLLARGEKIAVADGATGGLLSASLLSIPGATKFYLGGGVVYSRKGRDVLFDLPDEAFTGMRSATSDYALLQARAIRDRFGADWGIAESGSAGGSVHPLGIASGLSCAAVVGPGVDEVLVTETDSDGRLDNMATFTRRALELLDKTLADQG
ncbi:MAG: CinA family protein [Novosphingobium sp.]|nr:CinA family protein [Novosphingobium sp.]